MSDEIKMSFSADDYRREYAEMKRFLPSEAKKVEEAVSAEFLDLYKKDVPPQGRVAETALVLTGFAGIGAVFGSVGGLALGALAAPVALPVLAAGFLGITVAGKVLESRDSSGVRDSRSVKIAKERIAGDIANGDLLKRFVDGRKRYNKPLPGGFLALGDASMAERYPPVIEASAVSVPPMALLSGPFNDNARQDKSDRIAEQDNASSGPAKPKPPQGRFS